MTDSIISLVAGLFAGVLSSLLSSLHPNNISSAAGLFGSPALFLIALYSTNVVLGTVVSAILLVPDPGTKAVPLPANRLAAKGKAGYAVALIIFSMCFACLIALVLSPVLSVAYSMLAFLSSYAVIFIAGFSAYSVLLEKKPWYALFYFVIAGTAGYATLNLLSDPFIPMFSGLFGVPALLLAGRSVNHIRIDFSGSVLSSAVQRVWRSKHLVLAGIVLSFFAELVPAVSSDSQLAFMAIALVSSPVDSLILLTSISASHMLTTLIALSSLGITRTGFASAYSQFRVPGISDLALFFFLVCAVSAVALRFAKLISTINIQNFSSVALVFLVFVNLLANGFPGLLALVVFSAIGHLPHVLGVKRFLGMGCLIVPVLAKTLL